MSTEAETAYGPHIPFLDEHGHCRICGFVTDDGRAEHIEAREFEVQHWQEVSGDPANEGFWVKDAMVSAVGQWWYAHRNTDQPLADEITLTLDRERGIVILKEGS